MARRLTLVAGSGSLVPLIAEAARREGGDLQVIDLVGRGDVTGDRTEQIPLSEASRLIEAVKSFRTTHMVLAGAVQISDADREGIARAFGFVGKMARSLGDVGFAGMVLVYCRMIGVKLVGAHDVVEFLSQIQVEGQSGLQVVMGKWLENSNNFAGYDEIRQKYVSKSPASVALC